MLNYLKLKIENHFNSFVSQVNDSSLKFRFNFKIKLHNKILINDINTEYLLCYTHANLKPNQRKDGIYIYEAEET